MMNFDEIVGEMMCVTSKKWLDIVNDPASLRHVTLEYGQSCVSVLRCAVLVWYGMVWYTRV